MDALAVSPPKNATNYQPSPTILHAAIVIEQNDQLNKSGPVVRCHSFSSNIRHHL